MPCFPWPGQHEQLLEEGSKSGTQFGILIDQQKSLKSVIKNNLFFDWTHLDTFNILGGNFGNFRFERSSLHA